MVGPLAAASAATSRSADTAAASVVARDELEQYSRCDRLRHGQPSLTVMELGVDVDELEVRATSEASARLAAQADEPVRVHKKDRGKRKSGDKRRGRA